MKVVVLNNLNDKEFHEVIGGHEVVTLSKNYLKSYYNADLFTDCKKVSTALRRFFKALEKDYISFNNYKKEIEESVKQGIYTKSLLEKFDFGFTIGMTHKGFYISVTVPMEQEPEQEEEETAETEQEEENTNMKNIKIKKTDRGYYTVVADTQKFGTNEILFEGRNIEECKNYIKRTLIFILKAQLLKNRTQEAGNTIKTLISYLNDKKQKTINNNIAKSWELFSTGAINMEISETEKGYYFVGEQAPVKFTFFIDKEGKDTRKQKNDKVVNTLTDDFVVEF